MQARRISTRTVCTTALVCLTFVLVLRRDICFLGSFPLRGHLKIINEEVIERLQREEKLPRADANARSLVDAMYASIESDDGKAPTRVEFSTALDSCCVSFPFWFPFTFYHVSVIVLIFIVRFV